MSIPPALPYVTPWEFTPEDRIAIDAIEYVWQETTSDGQLLARRDDRAIVERFSHAEIERISGTEGWRYGPRYYAPAKQRVLLKADVSRLSDLPAVKQAKVHWKWEFCSRFRKRLQARTATKSDASMTTAIEEIHAEVSKLPCAKLGPKKATPSSKTGASKRKPRAGQASLVRNPPTPKALRNWLRALDDGGYDLLALCDSYRRCGNRTPRLSAEIETLIRKHVALYQGEKRTPIAGLHRGLKAELEKINTARIADGHEPYACPSSRTFRKRVRGGLDAFAVYAGRHGVDAAKRKFQPVAEGLGATRPLQVVPMDAWVIGLKAILVKTKLWQHLTAAEKEEMSGRLTLFCAIDVATRCILGMRLSRTETAADAIATLQMVVNDKGFGPDHAGAVTPWDMFGTPHTILTDTGSSFIAEDFQSAAWDLGTAPLRPPAKLPHLRAHIERLFGTLDSRFISRFTGRTFSNTSELGDYPSAERASLTCPQLAAALVRFVVDEYHNTEHEGLGGETPRAAWIRLTKLYPVKPPPDRHTQRAIFGIPLERTLGNHGIRVLGLNYQSEELQQLHRKRGHVPLAVRVDRRDLGTISVWIEDAWYSVRCTREGLDGVGVEVWIQSVADLRRRHATAAAVTQPVVLAAIRDIAGIALEAERRAGIASTIVSVEEVERAEREVMLGFTLPSPPVEGERAAGPAADLFAGGIAVGRTTTIPDVEPSPDATPIARPTPATKAPPRRRTRMED